MNSDPASLDNLRDLVRAAGALVAAGAGLVGLVGPRHTVGIGLRLAQMA